MWRRRALQAVFVLLILIGGCYHISLDYTGPTGRLCVDPDSDTAPRPCESPNKPQAP